MIFMDLNDMIFYFFQQMDGGLINCAHLEASTFMGLIFPAKVAPVNSDLALNCISNYLICLTNFRGRI